MVDGLHSRSRKHHALTACRYQVQAQGRDMINPMAQPHKGDREQIKVRAAAVVYARLREMAAERNTSVSQISADLLAIAVGHPEAVRELNRDKEVLPLAM
jgi:hypothetical protein